MSKTLNGKACPSERKPELRTRYQRSRAKHDKAVYDRYQELISQPGAMATAVQAKVMKEFGIYSRSTVYRTLERVETTELQR